MQRCGDKERSEEGVDREDAYLQQMQSRRGRGRGLRGCGGGGRAAPHCCSQQAFGRDGVVLVRTGLGVVLWLAIHRKNFELKRCGGVVELVCQNVCVFCVPRHEKAQRQWKGEYWELRPIARV
jgi:hypothetical protein